MKKIFPILTVALLAISTACGGGSKSNDSTTSANDSIANDTAVDSLAIALSRLDSIQSKGQLVHFDTWKIGNLKGVEVQAQKFSSENDSIVFITLRKDCGGEYYYSWEDAFIFQKELPSLYEAINTIKSNLNRKTDHNEKYAYTTKDNVVVFAENPGKGWNLKLSVDAHKSNAYINLTTAELDKLVELLQQANNKLDEIK
ncbi:hypothetical protein [uncultured Alistipes sp.]|uniref:hypothetical protein n=1 Tax=uncultured Alistipes sp. TaxID=538949 RepID=UPI002609E531|nr:hypothetical protein [uncultured Alistipes sp.]